MVKEDGHGAGTLNEMLRTLSQKKYSVSYICNLKFSSSHVKKVKKTHKINFNIFYSTQYIQDIIISTCKQ